jgi:hypothetical protein
MVKEKRQEKHKTDGPHFHVLVITTQGLCDPTDKAERHNEVENLYDDVNHPRKKPAVKWWRRKLNVDVEIGGNAHNAHVPNINFVVERNDGQTSENFRSHGWLVSGGCGNSFKWNPAQQSANHHPLFAVCENDQHRAIAATDAFVVPAPGGTTFFL